MVSEPTPVWQPDWGVPPGEILLEALQERTMTQSELARRMDRPLKTINEIVKGKAAITPETAIQLERALGISARVWNGLETAYREHVAWQQALEQLEREAGWVDRFPIKDLVSHGLLRRAATKAATLAELLAFFRVSSPSAWERHWSEQSVSFRSSPAFATSPHAVAAWLRWGEIEASKLPTASYDAQRFRRVLKEARHLTRQPFPLVFDRLRELCATAGVVVVVTPELNGTRVSGAARWLASDKALIQLSLRHKSEDHLWFSFFHEAGHLLRPTRRRDFVDAADQDDDGDHQEAEEQQADQFARDTLIPPQDYAAFLQRGDITTTAVQAFAKAQDIAPGIVVGRLHRDKHIAPSQLAGLKKPIRWGQVPQ
jgi:HTH-type transcriptional regulator / antitoxin HigA